MSTSEESWPDAAGRYGEFGGRFIPELGMSSLIALEAAWNELRTSTLYWDELLRLLSSFGGRPTPIYVASRLGERIVLKRDDLTHTGSAWLTAFLGQALVARHLRRWRVVVPAAVGSDGIAAATACARLDLQCVVYMGAQDVRACSSDIKRMEALGARVAPIETGSCSLRDATVSAMRDWLHQSAVTMFMAREPVGPHPYPRMLTDITSLIGVETTHQLPVQPAAVVATAPHALGMFYAYVPNAQVNLVAVEPRGGCLHKGTTGIYHGCITRVLKGEDGQALSVKTIAPTLDYPAIGPELAFMLEHGRIDVAVVKPNDAYAAWRRLIDTEGMIVSLEAAYAISAAVRVAARLQGDAPILVHVEGCGGTATDAALQLDDDVRRPVAEDNEAHQMSAEGGDAR